MCKVTPAMPTWDFSAEAQGAHIMPPLLRLVELPLLLLAVEPPVLSFPLCGKGFRVSDFRVQGSGFRDQGSEIRVQGSGFRVQGSGFRVQGGGWRLFSAQGHFSDGC